MGKARRAAMLRQDRGPDAEVLANRSFRVPVSLWNAAQDEADRRGETLSDAMRRMLARYAKGGTKQTETTEAVV